VGVVRTTQRKGDLAVATAIATFTRLGWDVSVPLTESASYDLVVDDTTRLHRVQCRFSSTREVNLRRIHSNSQGYVVKRFEPNSYDWLYVLRPTGEEYLMEECHSGRRSITPRPEHLIRGAVAEWTIAPALKADDPKRSVGSNPTRSAKSHPGTA
jgi:hypothetical protein